MTTPPSSWALTTTTRSTRAIRSSTWIRSAWASWSRWLPPMAALPVPTWAWASAASTAATPLLSSSATTSAWTTSAALPSVCPSPVWPPHRLQLKTRGSKSYLSFDHDVTFCEASAWCKRADYPFRHSSWKDMTLSVNLDLN